MPSLSALAEQLRALHHTAEPLVLANVWDAASARSVVDAGFPAVATTSSGMSAALGYADGEHTPAAEMFWAIARLSRVVPDTPVTADVEAGYGLQPTEVIRKLLEAGAVGCNYEDTDHTQGEGHALRDAGWQAERIAALRAAARAEGVEVVINARVDGFLRAHANPDETLQDAIHRGKLYLEAGADCIFPIGAPDEATIAALVKGIPGPVNAIPAFRGSPPLARLRELGVRRISYAGRLHRAMLTDYQRRLASIKNWQDS